jgi:hypothetical protein
MVALHALDEPRVPTGRLFVAESALTIDGVVAAQEFVYTAGEGHDIAFDRREGRCLVSYQRDGEWVAVSKSLLTHVMGQGRDALITDIDADGIELLRLTCPGVVVLSE